MKKVLGTFDSPGEAFRACREYRESTGLYARVVAQTAKDSPVAYVVYGYGEPCRLDRYIPDVTHDGLRILARAYMNATKLRTSLAAMAKHPSAPDVVHSIVEDVAEDKESILDRAAALVSKHPIYGWCEIVSAGRGSLGAAAALTFLGFIDPHEATTAGKAKSFWGLTPEGKLRSGERAGFNPLLKGFATFAAQRVIMGKDSYYVPLYQAKKEYYVSKGIKHAHPKAVFWLAALLVSHAQQIIREAEGYEVPRHRMHIRPKDTPDETPPEQTLAALRRGEILDNP
jgi:hypothetical protein